MLRGFFFFFLLFEPQAQGLACNMKLLLGVSVQCLSGLLLRFTNKQIIWNRCNWHLILARKAVDVWRGGEAFVPGWHRRGEMGEEELLLLLFFLLILSFLLLLLLLLFVLLLLAVVVVVVAVLLVAILWLYWLFLFVLNQTYFYAHNPTMFKSFSFNQRCSTAMILILFFLIIIILGLSHQDL